jgi:hypothetical protein
MKEMIDERTSFEYKCFECAKHDNWRFSGDVDVLFLDSAIL